MKFYTDIDNYLLFLKLEKEVIIRGNIQAKKLYDKLFKKYSQKKYIDLYNDWHIKNLLHMAIDLKKTNSIKALKRRKKIEEAKKCFSEIEGQFGEHHAKDMIKTLYGKKMLEIISDEKVNRLNRSKL